MGGGGRDAGQRRGTQDFVTTRPPKHHFRPGLPLDRISFGRSVPLGSGSAWTLVWTTEDLQICSGSVCVSLNEVINAT